jgi:tetratricopeptide (TPR) repeat protein
VSAEAKALLAAGDVPAALERYRLAFEELIAKDEHHDASNIAHTAGVADEEAATKHLWNVLALREADAEPDRASVAGFYPSLYHNLAFSHLQLGESDDALRCLRQAWSHVGALEPGPYADRVKAAIKKRLDELTR